VTKYRKKVITSGVAKAIDEAALRVLEPNDSLLLESNGEADHRHFLIETHPAVTPSTLINTLKTVTSRRVRKDFAAHLARFYHKPVFWSASYCLLSTGGASIETIRRYIENQ
jgi:putative transposase